MSTIAFKLYVYGGINAEHSVCYGEVRGIDSLQWLEEYADSGEVKLVCASNANNVGIIDVGRRIINTERSKLAAVIDSVEYSTIDGESKMTVRAKFSTALWQQRVLTSANMPDETDAELAILHIANACKGDMPISVSAALGLGVNTDVTCEPGTAFDAIKNIAQSCNFGFCHVLDDEYNETFMLYSGIDRTHQDSDDYKGYFATSANNIAEITVETGDENYKNMAIVRTQIGDEELFVTVDSAGTQEMKRQIYIDASDIKDSAVKTDESGNTQKVTYTQSEILDMLRARGTATLAQHKKTFYVSAQLKQLGIIFGKDYDVGDILPIVIEYKSRVILSGRLTSVNITYETNKKIEAILEVSV